MVNSVGNSGNVSTASQTGNNFDISTVIMMLSLERAESLHGQMKDQAIR